METTEKDDLEWLEPWAPVDELLRDALERELDRELVAGHVLFGREIRALARRHDRDDVLFVAESPRQFAVVHLTYARETRPEWPHAMIFGSLQEFAEGCMVPDHEELTDEDVD